jgi:hypothetical protein
MLLSLNDRDPGRQKAVTNADEQEVAVNHSTADEGGYDEPNSASATLNDSSEESKGTEVKKEKKSEKGQSSQTDKT